MSLRENIFTPLIEKEREGIDKEVVNKMHHGIARLQAYRSFIEKMN